MASLNESHDQRCAPGVGGPGQLHHAGGGRGYDAAEFIRACDEMKVIPHVAQNKSGRRSAVPESVAQTPGYAQSQKKRKLIEQGFGWAKTVGSMRQVMVRGPDVCADDGCLQLGAHAYLGAHPSAGCQLSEKA